MSKGPAISQSPNLPPWQWKIEKAPKHQNLGPATQVSVNRVQAAPLLENWEELIPVSIECLESAKSISRPATANQRVLPSRETPVVEDIQTNKVRV